ncbi:hypothetical protein [Fodinibius halophilus]|uniref:HEPN AbiU2-like domain-containing protein n=1 Tax=Fodinibius halophilus TaxID=1736908 RepID=A0A6M1TL38_9BACT|nr:hypothetical protein [Fodinibius halophilus]NGP89190.1 hypothetical protein [Fodinibius halophilus]
MCVNIQQTFNSLSYYTAFIEENEVIIKGRDIPSREPHMDSAVLDSLWFQIILDSCSFLDEWDSILGVKTEKKFRNRILKVKKTAAVASRAVRSWKDLRDFRNEVIAHNFRDKTYNFTFDRMAHYDCPQSHDELWYLVNFIDRMANVLANEFPKKSADILKEFPRTMGSEEHRANRKSLQELNELLKKVDKEISFHKEK